MSSRLPAGIPRFGVRLGIAALVGGGAWWLVHVPLGAAFRGLGRLVLAGLGGSGTVALVPRHGAGILDPDARILFTASGAVLREVPLLSLRLAFIPLAVVCGLAYAARQWKRANWRRLLLGHAVVMGYAGLCVAILALYFGLMQPSVAFFAFAPLARVVDLVYRIVVIPGFEYVIPAVIWYGCTAPLIRA